MLTSSATTLANAEATVAHYRLDQHKWAGNGSAEGFARWLFLAGGNLDRYQIAHQMSAYGQACSTASCGGKKLNEELRVDAEGYSGALENVARARRRLSAFIGDLKRSPSGKSLWTMVARLATAPDPERLLRDLKARGSVSKLGALLESLQGFDSDFPDCSDDEYWPGQSAHLDRLLRMDIERLEKSLVEVPAWLGDVPERWLEISVLLRLANDADICLQAVAKAISRNFFVSITERGFAWKLGNTRLSVAAICWGGHFQSSSVFRAQATLSRSSLRAERAAARRLACNACAQSLI